MLIQELCEPRSNKSDWLYTTQLRNTDNGEPMWPGDPPSDLITTITLRDKRGITRFSSKSNDGTGVVAMRTASFLDVMIPAEKMSSLEEGRYRVHFKFETEGRVIDRLFGNLSVMEGA